MNYPKAIKEILRLTYLRLFKIDDTPQRVALGFGLGVFLGIFPGTGPIAALFCAWILRVNRAGALLGCLLTNTWISIVTLLLSIKAGAVIMNVHWQEVGREWSFFLKNFHWIDLFKLSVLKVILPVIVGYLAVGLCFGLSAYLIALAVLKGIKHADKNRINLSR